MCFDNLILTGQPLVMTYILVLVEVLKDTLPKSLDNGDTNNELKESIRQPDQGC